MGSFLFCLPGGPESDQCFPESGYGGDDTCCCRASHHGAGHLGPCGVWWRMTAMGIRETGRGTALQPRSAGSKKEGAFRAPSFFVRLLEIFILKDDGVLSPWGLLVGRCHMSNFLTAVQKDQYEQDGILFPIPVLSSEEAKSLLSRANEFESQLGKKVKTIDLTQMHLYLPWAYDLAGHPRVLDAVESILGPDIIVWSTGLFNKHPHNPSYVSWHQDGTYWNFGSMKICTAWIALSNSTVANGCMRVVRKSHGLEIQPHVETYAENNALTRGQEIQVDVSDEDATDVVLTAGQMSLHHVNIIHGSLPNKSDEKRVGYVIRYVTPRTKMTGERPMAVLARGQDSEGNFELVDRPSSCSAKEMFQRREQVTERHRRSLMKHTDEKSS